MCLQGKAKLLQAGQGLGRVETRPGDMKKAGGLRSQKVLHPDQQVLPGACRAEGGMCTL